MFYLLGYALLILAELVFAISFLIFTLSLIFSSLKGAPYVPTNNKELAPIFEAVNFKKGQYLIELGCGDGRVVRNAVINYKLKGLGVDVNPILIFLSRLYTRLKHVENLTYKRLNIFDPHLQPELKKADFIYLFMMPKLITKLRPTLIKYCKKSVCIISHGFKIEDWDKQIYKTLPRKPFPTYYYHIPNRHSFA